MSWPWNPGQKSLEVIGTDTDQPVSCDFLLSLARTVSEINDDFSWKSQSFPHPVYLTPPLNGFAFELGTDARGQKKQNDEATRRSKKI